MQVRAARAGVLIWLPVLVIAAFAFVVPTSSADVAGSLTVAPNEYYGGQAVRYSGRLGSGGVRKIWLEYNMNRPGDKWTRIEGFSTYTHSSGAFDFTYPARGMLDISIRVAAQGTATPAKLFHAREQELAVSVQPEPGGLLESLFDLLGWDDYTRYPAVAGEPFQLTVDTSPHGTPILVGRQVTLQRRATSGQWSNVATGQVNRQGVAMFEQTVASAGTVVYRAKAGSWTQGGSRIGWFPSFPTYVDVTDESRASRVLSRTSTTTQSATTSDDTTPVSSRLSAGGPTTTASSKYGWGRAVFDFGWIFGESLTDRPYRGSRRQGLWMDTSTGSGRAAQHNGGLMLESKFGYVVPGDAGSGDHGTTAVTLRGNAQTYGRWEVRIRPWVIENDGKDYRVKFELIPDDPTRRACGARAITVADLTPRRSEVRIGAYSPIQNKAWRRTQSSVPVAKIARAYAVEVAADHISWFVDGRIIGTVRAKAAIPGVPLTMRLSLVGADTAEMNHTYAHFDWVRGFGIKAGQHPTNGAALTAGTHSLHC
ncbi:MAG TPA: hypothetical protein VEK80_04320 [Kribbellaceae bacterium]|nr:hypothetical protein [Kribbellaceae bacterium]